MATMGDEALLARLSAREAALRKAAAHEAGNRQLAVAAVMAALDASGHGSAGASDEVAFRRAAAYVLAEAAPAAAVPALLDLSRAADPRTRLYAVRGLGRLSQDAPEAGARVRELES